MNASSARVPSTNAGQSPKIKLSCTLSTTTPGSTSPDDSPPRHHFLHFREAFERFGIPQAICTDGLSLFDPNFSHDHLDPRSEFQRALRAIGAAHLVTPSPQVKGKIERRFGTFQKRLVPLLAHAQVDSNKRANEILPMKIKRQNSTKNSSTGEAPNNLFEHSQHHSAIRPSPSTALLDRKRCAEHHLPQLVEIS